MLFRSPGFKCEALHVGPGQSKETVKLSELAQWEVGPVASEIEKKSKVLTGEAVTLDG